MIGLITAMAESTANRTRDKAMNECQKQKFGMVTTDKYCAPSHQHTGLARPSGIMRHIQLLNAEIFYLYLFQKSERGSLFRRACVTEHEIILFLLVVELLGKTSFAPSSLFILTRFLFLFLFYLFFCQSLILLFQSLLFHFGVNFFFKNSYYVCLSHK